MATSDKDIWQKMQSYLEAMGYGAITMIGEPRSGVESRMIAIIPSDGHVEGMTLQSPWEVHYVFLRFYVNWLEEPAGEIEFVLDQFRADILQDICGDYDLGATLTSAWPSEFTWEFGEHTVEAQKYRTITLRVAYRVDDRATLTE